MFSYQRLEAAETASPSIVEPAAALLRLQLIIYCMTVQINHRGNFIETPTYRMR